MKILHTADIHLGMELYGHYDPRTGASSRLQDFTAALDRAVDYAIDERVDLFLFAGDAYKTRDPSPTQQREFALRLRRLLEAQIPVFLLTGNHDMPNAFGRATSLDIFGALALPHLHVAARPAVHRVETPSGPIQVVAVPWLSRSTLFAREEMKSASIEETNRQLLMMLETFLSTEMERLDRSLPTILTVHGSVAGAQFDSDRTTMLGNDLLIPRGLIAHPIFAYVALGHIHKHQQLSSTPPVVYAGGLERIDFGEEKDSKGFVIVEIDGGRTEWRFVPSGARPFLTIRVKADGDDPTSEAIQAVHGRSIEGAIVRLDIHLTAANESSFQEGRVRAAVRSAYYFTVLRTVDRVDRQRGDGFSTAQSPLDNLSSYLRRHEVPADRSALLREYARVLLDEEKGGGHDVDPVFTSPEQSGSVEKEPAQVLSSEPVKAE